MSNNIGSHPVQVPLNHSPLSAWPSGLKRQVGKRWLLVRFLVETYILILISFFRLLPIPETARRGGAHANEIKHYHSPVVHKMCIVLYPRYD